MLRHAAPERCRTPSQPDRHGAREIDRQLRMAVTPGHGGLGGARAGRGLDVSREGKGRRRFREGGRKGTKPKGQLRDGRCERAHTSFDRAPDPILPRESMRWSRQTAACKASCVPDQKPPERSPRPRNRGSGPAPVPDPSPPGRKGRTVDGFSAYRRVGSPPAVPQAWLGPAMVPWVELARVLAPSAGMLRRWIRSALRSSSHASTSALTHLSCPPPTWIGGGNRPRRIHRDSVSRDPMQASLSTSFWVISLNGDRSGTMRTSKAKEVPSCSPDTRLSDYCAAPAAQRSRNTPQSAR